MKTVEKELCSYSARAFIEGGCVVIMRVDLLLACFVIKDYLSTKITFQGSLLFLHCHIFLKRLY